MGLKPPQNFFFANISKSTAARGVQNFGLIEGAAGILNALSPKFSVKLGQGYDEHMLKISKRCLKQFLNNH